jgi:hypothetical protein
MASAAETSPSLAIHVPDVVTPPTPATQEWSSHVLLFGQFGLSLLIISFCIGMVASQKGSEAIYLPILTAIVGIWLPQPVITKTTTGVVPPTPPATQTGTGTGIV